MPLRTPCTWTGRKENTSACSKSARQSAGSWEIQPPLPTHHSFYKRRPIRPRFGRKRTNERVLQRLQPEKSLLPPQSKPLQAPPETFTPSPLEKIFLEDLLLHPFDGADQRSKRLGLIPRDSGKLQNNLIDKGIIFPIPRQEEALRNDRKREGPTPNAGGQGLIPGKGTRLSNTGTTLKKSEAFSPIVDGSPSRKNQISTLSLKKATRSSPLKSKPVRTRPEQTAEEFYQAPQVQCRPEIHHCHKRIGPNQNQSLASHLPLQKRIDRSPPGQGLPQILTRLIMLTPDRSRIVDNSKRKEQPNL